MSKHARHPLVAVRWLTGATGSLAAAALVALYASTVAPDAALAAQDRGAPTTPPSVTTAAALPITTYAPIFPTPTADQPQPWTETDGPLHVDAGAPTRVANPSTSAASRESRPTPAPEAGRATGGEGVAPRDQALPAATPDPTPPADVAGAEPAQPITAGVTDLVNAARAQAGCLPITDDPELTDYAQQWAQTQAADGWMHHSGGPYAENVAAGYESAADVMQGWMTSTKGHLENILTCAWTRHGIGAATVDGRTYWTQVFST